MTIFSQNSIKIKYDQKMYKNELIDNYYYQLVAAPSYQYKNINLKILSRLKYE